MRGSGGIRGLYSAGPPGEVPLVGELLLSVLISVYEHKGGGPNAVSGVQKRRGS